MKAACQDRVPAECARPGEGPGATATGLAGRVVCMLLGIALLCGCANATFNPSGSQRFPPYEGAVEVLSRLPEPGSYDLLGVVVAKGVALTSDERMFDQARERAAAQGADAIIPQGEIRTRLTSDGGEDRSLAVYAIRRR